MDASKVVKTSQFNFDNIYTNTEPTKIKVTTKVTNLNPLPPTTSDRSRFVSISGQNKISVIYVNDKSRVLKNPSPLPGLNTNERKPVNLGLKPQSKKLPLKIPANSPLTGKDQGPHSSQFQNRRLDLFEPKPKEFRVRTGSSQSKIYTESNSVHSSSRYHRDSSIQPEKLGSSFDTGELNVEKMRSSDLARVNLASVVQHREGLPLLIMHFEGIIGSCCVNMKEVSKEKGKDADESPGYFIRKGVKSELKHLAKKFLLVVVFPSFESRYKKVAKHLINSKFYVDGIYYSTKGEKPKKFHRIEDYMLNYNKILEDFKEKMPDRKVVLLVPMNVSPKVAKANFLLKGSPDDLQNFERTTDYEEKQFLGFFPKIKMNIANLKIVCIPNFTLSEKNDRFSVLAKSSFSDVAKMLEHIHQEIAETILSSIIPSECKLDKSSTKHSSPTPLASVSLNQIDAKSDDGSQQIASSKETEAGSQALTEDKENKVQKKTNDVGLRPINLEPLIAGIEKVLEYNKKWQKINQLKQAASVDPLQVPSEFDLASMKQKIIESLIETQKAKGYVRGNIMHHFLVGDLFSRNNHLFRFYEKDNFYLKKAYEQVSAISMNLNTGLQASNNFESMQKRERVGFESAPLSAKTPKSRMTQSTEDELIEILLIRRQARVMQLYLGD